MKFGIAAYLLLVLCFTTFGSTHAQVVPGPVSDFESETLEGWAGGANPVIISDGWLLT